MNEYRTDYEAAVNKKTNMDIVVQHRGNDPDNLVARVPYGVWGFSSEAMAKRIAVLLNLTHGIPTGTLTDLTFAEAVKDAAKAVA